LANEIPTTEGIKNYILLNADIKGRIVWHFAANGAN